MTLTHRNITELSQKYPENTQESVLGRDGKSAMESTRTEKMECLDSDTDREIETDVEETKSIQKYTVSLLTNPSNILQNARIPQENVHSVHNFECQWTVRGPLIESNTQSLKSVAI